MWLPSKSERGGRMFTPVSPVVVKAGDATSGVVSSPHAAIRSAFAGDVQNFHPRVQHGFNASSRFRLAANVRALFPVRVGDSRKS